MENYLKEHNREYDIIEIIFSNKNQIPTNDIDRLKIFSFNFGSIEGGYSYFKAGYGGFMMFNPEDVTKAIGSPKDKVKKLNELWFKSIICIDDISIVNNKIYLLMNKHSNKDKNKIDYYSIWKKNKKYQLDSMYGEFVFFFEEKIKRIKYSSESMKNAINFIDKNTLN